MGVSKVTLNGVTLMDVTDKTVDTDNLLAGNSALRNDGESITGAVVTASPSDVSPAMDGTASAGVATTYSRGDHVHPSDTNKANINNPSFTGIPTAPTASKGTNTTQIATTAFVQSAIADINYPVTSVNSKTGTVVLTASDVNALPDDTEIPTKTSDLTNDSGYITNSDIPVTSVNTKTGDVVLTAADVNAQPQINISGILKGNGTGTITAATAGTDYQAPLPSQTGNTGKFLTTNGSALSWQTVDALPSQSGNTGKFLTTNGSSASWAEVDVPTKTSDLTNDSNFITAAGAPVQSVNSKTGAITLTASDVGALPDSTDVTKWNGVSLTKTSSNHYSGYVPYMSATDSTSATLQAFSSTRTSGKIAAWDSSGYLYSSTPTARDNSGKVATTEYVDSAISGLGSILNYKGTKATESALPSTGNVTGDVWIVSADSSEYVWNGTAWEKFGPTIDLSGYVPTTRTVNGKALSTDISLDASDVGALPDSTVIPDISGKVNKSGDTMTGNLIFNSDAKIRLKYGSSSTYTDIGASGNNGGTTIIGFTSNLTNNKVILDNIAAPTDTYHAANKKYVDDKVAAITVPVTSVNSKTGDVVLTAADVGALPDSTTYVSSVNGNSGAITVTDEKLKTTSQNTQGNMQYVLTGTSSDTASTKNYANNLQFGQNSNNGSATLAVGSSSYKGRLRLFNNASGSFYTNLNPSAVSNNLDVDLPSSSGTLALISNIPDSTSDLTNDSGFITSSDIPVTSVNSKTGAVVLDAEDVGALPDSTDVTKWGTATLGRSGANVNADTYIPQFTSQTATSTNMATATKTPTNYAIAKYDSDAYLNSTTPATSDNSTKVATTAFVKTAISNIDVLPSQTSHNGDFLTTNGTVASWESLPKEVFVATYGTTTLAEILEAYNAGKFIYAVKSNNPGRLVPLEEYVSSIPQFYFSYITRGGAPQDWAVSNSGWTSTANTFGYVPTTRTINSKSLSNSITLTASDVGALPDSTTIPTATSDLTNDSGFITSSDIPVTSVNNKTGAVSLTASDLGALTNSYFGYLDGDNNIIYAPKNWGNSNLFPFVVRTISSTLRTGATVRAFDSSTNLWTISSIYYDGVAKTLPLSLSYGIYLMRYSDGTTDIYRIAKASDIPTLTSTPTANKGAKYDSSAYLNSTTPAANDNSTKVATTAYVDNAVSSADALPDQTGQSGKFLTTNGTTASWVDNPPEIFWITVNTSTLTADKTFAEIAAAVGDNKLPIVFADGNSIYLFLYLGTTYMRFTRYVGASGKSLRCNSDDTWEIDYNANLQEQITASGLLKGDGSGGVTAATAGTDYQAPISNNVTGSGTSGYLAKFNGTNTVTSGPALGSATTTFLRNDGSWATPSGTYSLPTASSSTKGGVKVGTGLTMSSETLNHSNSVTAGTAGTSSATSGATLAVPYVTYDAQGHVTASGTHTHTIGSLNTSAITAGTLGVARGGTGATTISGAVIGNGTSAFTGRAIQNNTSTGINLVANNFLITQNTLRYHTNRLTSVAAADTNYTTLMARGIGLRNADTNPGVNGAINFTYE